MTKNERGQHREAILRDFQDSGMTQKVFCRDRGLPISTLQYWLNRERKRSRATRGTELVPIGTVEAMSSGMLLRIFVRDGVSIEVERPVGESELAMILKAVAAS